jgi:nitric-oxide synthase
MSTEISMRNFCDSYRYDYQEKMAIELGFNVETNLSLWKEKTLTVFNEAVLYSYNKSGVSIVD